MKQPKIGNLIMDVKGTRDMHSRMARAKKVKITINIDHDSLLRLRAQSDKTGVPYQRLLNLILVRALKKDQDAQSRLERLEQEVAKLKRRLAA
jgi:predicted DNA binding CopG/RHH family protein